MNKKKKHSLKNRRHSHRKKKHTVLKVISVIVLLLIIAIASISYAAYRNIESTFSTSYENFPKTTSIDLKKSKTFTTLIIATGKNNSKNTAYATVLASTNVKTNQTTFMNFPVFATMPNQKTITEVYNTNGDDGIFQMVKDLLNVSINKVIQIDVNKMGSLVQAMVESPCKIQRHSMLKVMSLNKELLIYKLLIKSKPI
ncbi:Transcriptional regulator LytR [Lactococcus lactis]|nr:Transcriptional regulator LytR [Lactococcus lactis]